MFIPGERYSRKDVCKILKVEKPKGNWFTGYTKYKDDFYIFATIKGAGRTGHNYNNRWKGNDLLWSAKTKTNINQREIKELLTTNNKINIFTRDKDRGLFTYQGLARVKSFKNVTPVKIVWRFNTTNDINTNDAWTNLLANANDYLESGETFFSPNKHQYKITSVTGQFVTFKRLNSNSKVEYKLLFDDFEKGIQKANSSNGIMSKGEIDHEDAIEDTLVELTPSLDWDDSLKNIIVENKIEKVNSINPTSITEAKDDNNFTTITRQLRARRGQNKLRKNLFSLYEKKCCISGCTVKELLHACHILPHAESGNNSSTNALLLRSDIHDLFDANLIGIHPQTLTIKIKKKLLNTEYTSLNGTKLLERTDKLKPNKIALKERWALFNSK